LPFLEKSNNNHILMRLVALPNVRENNINHIIGSHLKAEAFKLNLFFDMVLESWLPSGHEFESHHPYLSDKK
jgi:hypothetical protein